MHIKISAVVTSHAVSMELPLSCIKFRDLMHGTSWEQAEQGEQGIQGERVGGHLGRRDLVEVWPLWSLWYRTARNPRSLGNSIGLPGQQGESGAASWGVVYTRAGGGVGHVQRHIVAFLSYQHNVSVATPMKERPREYTQSQLEECIVVLDACRDG